jgi:hypothetical protein
MIVLPYAYLPLDDVADLAYCEPEDASDHPGPWLIYLGILNGWCTMYVSDTYPDFCAIEALYPPESVCWDIVPL